MQVFKSTQRRGQQQEQSEKEGSQVGEEEPVESVWNGVSMASEDASLTVEMLHRLQNFTDPGKSW